METLGNSLAAAREKKKLTLRAVEAKTGISNAYLSQLEGGKIRSPSPVNLHKLSKLYGISYALTLERAGYPVPEEKSVRFRNSRFAARLGPTTAQEEDALIEYLEFLRSKNRKGRRR